MIVSLGGWAAMVSSPAPAMSVSLPEPAYIVSPAGGSPSVANVYMNSS